MKTFQFNLEPVLTLRTREEKVAEEAWVAALRTQSRIATELANAEEEFSHIEKHLLQAMGTPQSTGQRSLELKALSQLREHCGSLSLQLQEATQAVVKAQEALVHARMRKETIVHLKDKRRDKHLAAVKSWEESQLDDLVMSRFGRERSRA